jgi:hypothetical protein
LQAQSRAEEDDVKRALQNDMIHATKIIKKQEKCLIFLSPRRDTGQKVPALQLVRTAK